MTQAASIQYTSPAIQALLRDRFQQKRDNTIDYKQAVIDVEKQRKLEPELVREFSSKECYLNHGIISTSLSLTNAQSKSNSPEIPKSSLEGSTSSQSSAATASITSDEYKTSNERKLELFPSNIIAQSRSDIDAKRIKDKISKEFNNSEIMSACLCLARSIYLDSSIGRLSYIERIRDEIVNLRNIGEGLYGTTFTGDVKFKNQAPEILIIKAPNDPKKPDELIHEIAVGMFGINDLRNYIPHFSMVFGGFDCSPPIMDNKGSVVAWCNSSANTITYALYENIQGVTLENYLYSCSIDGFFSVYLQIIYSLIFAYNICAFTHYDLHLGNVIVRRVSNKSLWIAFPPTGLKNDPRKIDHWIFSPDGVIPVFIDYGRTHIQVDYKGQELHLGYVGESAPLYEIGVDQNHANIMGDIYKITCMCLTALKLRNKNVFYQVTSLLAYFNISESIPLIIESQGRRQFPLPLDEKQSIAAGPPENFLTKILKDNPKFNRFITTTQPKDDILKIESGQMKARQILSEFGVTGSLITPKTFIEFYDLYSFYESIERTSVMLSLEKEFSTLIDSAWSEEKKKQSTLLKIIESPYVKQIPGIDILDEPSGIISAPMINYLSELKYLESYENFTIEIGRYVDTWQKLVLSIKATDYIALIFDRADLLNVTTILKKKLIDRWKSIETYSNIINYIYSILFPSSRDEQNRVQRFKEAIMRLQDGRRMLRMWDNFYILKGILDTIPKEIKGILE